MTDRDRRALIILGVVVLLGGGVGAFLVLSGDGGAPDEGPAPTQVASPSPGATPSPEASPEPEGEAEDEEKPRLAYIPPGRDPFLPLIVAEEAAPTEGEPTDGEEPADRVRPTDGEEPTDGAAVEKGESMTVGGKTVVLIDIFTEGGTQKVQVEVDGETFVVAEGDQFAGNFQLVNISGGCASFLFGDQSFTLCEPGERK